MTCLVVLFTTIVLSTTYSNVNNTGDIGERMFLRRLQSTQISNSTSTEDSIPETILDVIIRYSAVIVLICFSGLFSGLTLGLMGLDKIGLEVSFTTI